MVEATIRYLIDRNLENKNWILNPNSENRNVFLENDLPEQYRKKLERQRPDYTFFDNGKPIGVVEAKKSGIDLDKALKQATGYAEVLDAPLIFASNGAYCETRHLYTGKRLKLNGVEVKEFLRHKEALKFLESNTDEAYTIDKRVIKNRQELILVFKNINETLRTEGLRAGIERINEFANILFLKLLSEGKEGSDDLWSRIKQEPDRTLIAYINNTIIAELKKQYGGGVLSSLECKNVSTLRTIIGYLDPLLLNPVDWDIKGGAFEYFLEKSPSADNDLGEYYTPRHIVKTIVNLANPQFTPNIKEKIYDPFCGTGGFLTTAFSYLHDNNTIESADDLEILRNNCLYGREITTTARIAKMNMILHGDGHSGVAQMDSLRNPVKGEYDLVITNIPFSQKIAMKNEKGKVINEITDLYENGLAKNSGDGVCVLHCFNAVKKGGRMALVVPEGFLFHKSLKQVRNFLLGNSNLQSIISLPPEAFKPYASAKTNILYFTDCHYPHDQKNYWYFDVKNDGFSLDAHRRQLDGENDLDRINASSIGYEDEEEGQVLQNTGFNLIPMDKVKENNYNLDGKIYLEAETGTNRCEFVRLGDLCSIIRGVTYEKSDISTEETENRVLTADNVLIDGTLELNTKKKIFLSKKIAFDKKKKLSKGDIFICMSSGSKKHVGKVAYINDDIDIYCGGFMGILRCNGKRVLPYFLFLYLRSYKDIKQLARGTNIQNLNKKIAEISVPLPSLEEQQRIVTEIESLEKIIESNKKLINLMENKINKIVDSIWDTPKQNTSDIPPEKKLFNAMIKQASKPIS